MDELRFKNARSRSMSVGETPTTVAETPLAKPNIWGSVQNTMSPGVGMSPAPGGFDETGTSSGVVNRSQPTKFLKIRRLVVNNNFHNGFSRTYSSSGDSER
jgi:hypothetical protein